MNNRLELPRLCKAPHRRDYAEFRTMRSNLADHVSVGHVEVHDSA